MIDLSQPITPSAILQALTVAVAAVFFFAGLRYRLQNVEQRVKEATEAIKDIERPLSDLAKTAVDQSRRISTLETEVNTLRHKGE